MTKKHNAMPTPDIFLSLILALATLGLLFISPINLDVILASSGEPALIGENAWKRHLIAALAPLSSVAIKIIPMHFDFPESKRLFEKCLSVVTGCVVVTWIILLSQTFDSLSAAGFDINTIMQGDGSSTYVATQLLMEVLLGAVFFQAWSNLQAKHQKPKTDPNAAILDEQIIEHETWVAQASEREEKALTELETLRINRQVFIQKQIGGLALLKNQPPFYK